jgi:ribosomal protein S1
VVNNISEAIIDDRAKTKAISEWLKTLLKKPLIPPSKSQIRESIQKGFVKDFSNKNIFYNLNKKKYEGIDYDTIQFGENGFKFWIDYTNSFNKNYRTMTFLRNIAIKNAIARISSFLTIKKRKTFGPYKQRIFKKCIDEFILIPEFYNKNKIGKGSFYI